MEQTLQIQPKTYSPESMRSHKDRPGLSIGSTRSFSRVAQKIGPSSRVQTRTCLKKKYIEQKLSVSYFVPQTQTDSSACAPCIMHPENFISLPNMLYAVRNFVL